MHQATPLALIVLLLAAVSCDTGYRCVNYINSNDKFYNIQNLQTSDESKWSVTNQTIYIPSESKTVANVDFLFNICGTRGSPKICPSDLQSIGFVMYNGKCQALSRNSGTNNTQWSYHPYNENNKDEDGITISGNNTDDKMDFNINLAFKCDSTVTGTPEFQINQVETNSRIVITIKHKKSCGVDFSGPLSFLAHVKWPLLFAGIILGVSLCFFGIRIFKYSLAVLGFLVGFIIPYVIISLAWKDVENENKSYFIVGASLVLGFMCSYFVYTLRNVGLFIAGCFLGIVIGLEVYVLGVYKLEKSGSSVLLYVTIITMSTVIGILAIFIRNYILMLTTAIGGAWLSIRCIGSIIGNYPDEFTLTRDIEYGKLTEIPVIFYVYMGIILLMAIAGLFYQWKLYKESKDIQALEDGYNKV